MTALVFVGASGLAQEAINIVRAQDSSAQLSIVDDDPDTWGQDIGGVRVAGGLDSLDAQGEQRIVVCVGRGTARRRIVDRLSGLGVSRTRFATLVHPDVRVPADCVVGLGVIVMAGVVMTADVTIGDHVVVMPHVTLTHGDVLRDHATLCAGVALGGEVEVGDGAYLGMNASVRERVRVGRDALLGMGSVLLRDLPDHESWVGSPARPMATRLEAAR